MAGDAFPLKGQGKRLYPTFEERQMAKDLPISDIGYQIESADNFGRGHEGLARPGSVADRLRELERRVAELEARLASR